MAIRAAQALERWGWARDWTGSDPYDGLNAIKLASVLRRSPLLLRVLTQAVKRSPVDLRPLVGIPAGQSAASLALVLSAYARNGFLGVEEAGAKLRRLVAALEALRSGRYPEPCWGYHFDVQTRVFYYSRNDPNTIATAFAGLGLLDAFERAGSERALELAVGAGDFFLRRVPPTETASGAYFGYLVGDTTPIHNANLLVCALLARLARIVGRADFRAAAAAGVGYTLSCQRPDGSWPYGELEHLGWIDGFHTGYVLDCLLTCHESGVGGTPAEVAWRNGLRFYAAALIEADGTPRYMPGSRYPIDGQCVAQAIQTLARARAYDPAIGERAWHVFRYSIEQFARHDGSFAFQRERLWTNRAAHIRWVQAPMLLALTHLIEVAPL